MKMKLLLRSRKSLRLRGYDYSLPGSYFITANLINRIPLFGEIIKGKMKFNAFGQIAFDEWQRTSFVRPNIALGEFIIMPDHIHGIVIIKEKFDQKQSTDPVSKEKDSNFGIPGRGLLQYAPTRNPKRLISNSSLHFSSQFVPPSFSSPLLHASFKSPSQTLGSILRGYMGTVTKQINIHRNTPGVKIWQRNFNDHIIRTDKEFKSISRYIKANPRNWERDGMK